MKGEKNKEREQKLIKALKVGELSGFIENFDPKDNLKKLHQRMNIKKHLK